MLLQPPRTAHSPCKPYSREQPASARVTCARRCHRPACSAVVDTPQLIDQDVTNSSKDQPNILVKSQLDSSRAEFEMNSRVQVPRNKVLTTTMIAHATNKDVNQVKWYCRHGNGSLCCRADLALQHVRFRNPTPFLCNESRTKVYREHTVKAQPEKPVPTQSLCPASSSKSHFRHCHSGLQTQQCCP